MRYLNYFILVLLILNTISSKWDFRGNETENYSAQNIEVRITSDKSRYSYHDNIPIFIRISNTGFYPVTIYLSSNERKNFTIIGRDEKGASIKMVSPTLHTKTSIQSDPFYYQYSGTGYHARSLVIQPGETIEKQIHLKEWIEIPESTHMKRYQINSFFYPNPDQSNDYFIQSENTFSLIIDPDSISEKIESPFVNVSKGNISPREIVFLALASEYKREWQTFFKHISEKDIIKAYPDFAYKYAMASEKEKMIVINEFLEYLKNRKTHRLLSFQVLDEKITDILHSPYKNAQVKVKANRMIDGYEREFIYTYSLTSNQNTWLITGIETEVVK